jgi:hypothetical protein
VARPAAVVHQPTIGRMPRRRKVAMRSSGQVQSIASRPFAPSAPRAADSGWPGCRAWRSARGHRIELSCPLRSS